MVWTTLAVLVTAQAATGDPAIWMLWPPIVFILYGGAWTVAFMVRRSLQLVLVAAGCFATALAATALIKAPEAWLVLAAGTLCSSPARARSSSGGPAGRLEVQRLGRLPRRVRHWPDRRGDPRPRPPGRDGLPGRRRDRRLQYLKAKLEVTEGTLSVHLRKLEDAGYISIEKSFLRPPAADQARLTPAGREAFAAISKRSASSRT